MINRDLEKKLLIYETLNRLENTDTTFRDDKDFVERKFKEVVDKLVYRLAKVNFYATTESYEFFMFHSLAVMSILQNLTASDYLTELGRGVEKETTLVDIYYQKLKVEVTKLYFDRYDSMKEFEYVIAEDEYLSNTVRSDLKGLNIITTLDRDVVRTWFDRYEQFKKKYPMYRLIMTTSEENYKVDIRVMIPKVETGLLNKFAKVKMSVEVLKGYIENNEEFENVIAVMEEIEEYMKELSIAIDIAFDYSKAKEIYNDTKAKVEKVLKAAKEYLEG